MIDKARFYLSMRVIKPISDQRTIAISSRTGIDLASSRRICEAPQLGPLVLRTTSKRYIIFYVIMLMTGSCIHVLCVKMMSQHATSSIAILG